MQYCVQCGLSRLMHDDLHWLVIPQWVQYKLALTIHCCLCHRAPWYLADYCVPVFKVPGHHHLRSARCHQLWVPWVRHSTVGTRAFSVARPTVWNSLPDHLHNPAVDSEHFRRALWHICSPDIRNVSALEVLRNRAVQKSTFTYLLTVTVSSHSTFVLFYTMSQKSGRSYDAS